MIFHAAFQPLLRSVAAGAIALAASMGAAGAVTFAIDGPGTTGVLTDGDRTTLSYSYDLSQSGYAAQSWTVTAVADATTTYLFDWTYSGMHAWYDASARLETFDPLSTLVASTTWGGFSFAGNALAFDVSQGEAFGFVITADHFDAHGMVTGELALTELAAVPLPAGGALLLLGLAGLGIARRRAG